MKGWKETYKNILLDEAYNKNKEMSRIKKIDMLAGQIGKEIRKFPDEITDEGTDDRDLAQAFYDMNKGLGDLEYGIGDYMYYLKNLKEQKIVQPKEEISERLDAHKKSPAELKGAQFDRKKEINNIKKMIKGLEKLHKEHEKFQYNNRTTSGDRIFKGLYKAEDALYTYMLEIERGEWDGTVELES